MEGGASDPKQRERELAARQAIFEATLDSVDHGITMVDSNLRTIAEDALEQQIATARILRAISSSPTDTRPVFEEIAATALKLCRASASNVFTFDGELVRLAAFASANPAGAEVIRRLYPRPPDRETAATRAILTRAIVAIPDVLEDPDFGFRDIAIAGSFRSILAVPLLRDEAPVGAIAVGYPSPGPISSKQVELLQTFADQALIAIENVRLFNELQHRNGELTEALEQQIASAEILRAISRSPSDSQPVFDAIVRTGLTLFAGAAVSIALPDGGMVRAAAVAESDPDRAQAWTERFPFPLTREYMHGVAILDCRIVDVPDVANAPREWAAGTRNFLASGYRAVTIMPMLRGDTAIGALSVVRREPGPLSAKHHAALRTFTEQAVIAIENARLFNQTREALERQTATADILRVISSSPTSTAPVFQAILESSARLCDADMGLVLRYEEGSFQTIATLVPDPAFDAFLRQPIKAGPLSGLGRVAETRAPVHIPDLIDDEAYRARDPLRLRSVELGGIRTWLGVPMLREGELIGAIAIYRKEVRPFESRQVDVLRTFADQAVIAVENVRLFNETQEALRTQTATADILKVISESPTDVQPVFDAIAERAKVLCDAIVSGVFTFDGEWVQLVAYHGISEPADIEMRNSFPMRLEGGSIAVHAIRDAAPVQIYDVNADPGYQLKEAARQAGYRSNLGVPMLKEGKVVGSIVVCRGDPGVFPEQQIKLLETFADQAVIAIENVRLFNELREKGAQLELASRHKSEFLANMSHELRTPLNAIIGFTRIVMRRSKEQLEGKQFENLEKILQSGQNLLALINSILDLAKVEAGRVEVHPADIDLVPLLADCVRTIEPLVDDGQVKVIKSFEAAPERLFVDEEKLRQIVINLLSNAAKFTTRGSIVIESGHYDETAAVVVRDTGIGIPADKLEAIFEEFEQAGATGTGIQRGTGLGLTIARRLARLMGGDIRAESTPGAGSTFTLELPLRYAGTAS